MKPCPLCASREAQLFFTKNHHDVLRCSSCNFAYVNAAPQAQDLKQLYDKTYFYGDPGKFGYHDYLAEKQNRVSQFKTKIQYLQTQFPSGGLVLDVGCADGSFLELFPCSWTTEGVELSEAIWETIPQPLQSRVYQGFFEDFVSSAFYDAITLWDVVDHVADPKQTLQKAFSILKPGGLLGMVTGDLSSAFARLMGKHWYLYIPPVHLSYFSRHSIEKIFSDIGFEKPLIVYEGKRVSLALVFYRIAHLFPWRLWRSLFRSISNLFSDQVNFNLNFFDVMTIWARKPDVRN